jgi:hypothetical protein
VADQVGDHEFQQQVRYLLQKSGFGSVLLPQDLEITIQLGPKIAQSSLPRDLGCCPSGSPQLNGVESLDNRRNRHDCSQNQRKIDIHEPPLGKSEKNSLSKQVLSECDRDLGEIREED